MIPIWRPRWAWRCGRPSRGWAPSRTRATRWSGSRRSGAIRTGSRLGNGCIRRTSPPPWTAARSWSLHGALAAAGPGCDVCRAAGKARAACPKSTGYRWQSHPLERKPGRSRLMGSCRKARDAGFRGRPADFANDIRSVSRRGRGPVQNLAPRYFAHRFTFGHRFRTRAGVPVGRLGPMAHKPGRAALAAPASPGPCSKRDA